MMIKPGWSGKAFVLPDNSVIADIGFGHDPVRGATYYIDKDLEESTERGGLAAGSVPKDRFIRADVEKGIPLPDKSCDFVVASHILEHMDDPVSFCKELARIGRRGYIETPGVITELCNNRAIHKWYVWKFRERLYFIKKPRFLIAHEWELSGRFPFYIVCHIFREMCFPWEGDISCTVAL